MEIKPSVSQDSTQRTNERLRKLSAKTVSSADNLPLERDQIFMEQSLEPVSTEYWSVRKLDGTSIRIRKVENCMVNRQTDKQSDSQTGKQVDGQEDRQLRGWTKE